MVQTKTLFDEVETARGFTYLCGRVSSCEGCETAVAARTRCGFGYV